MAKISGLPYARDVRLIASEEPFYWLARGWRDFTVAPHASMAHGALFVAMGALLGYNVWRTDKFYLLLPIGSALVMLAPLICVGLHAISRAVELHRKPSFADAFFVWQDNFDSMILAALMFLFMFLAWTQLCQIALALTLSPAMVLNGHDISAHILSGGGLCFLALAAGLGVGFLALTLLGAWALPMMLHRDIGAAEAVATSFTATLVNWRAALVWAAIVVALVIAGMAFCVVGLAVTLPLVGHANWHGYRAMVAR